MGLINIGIKKVRVFEIPCGIWGSGLSIGSSQKALVKWSSSWDDKFYQVYVNGRYGGVTLEESQRQMVVALPTSFEIPVRIEVFAVEAVETDIDYGDQIDEIGLYRDRVKLKLLRSQALPAGATAQIYFDNGTGVIDYENPVNNWPIKIWPVWQDKAGFGMSRFGASDFGYDWSAGVGFGKGSFGEGEFGVDEDVIEYVSESLQMGVYKFVAKVVDEAGNESGSSEIEEILVIPVAKCVGEVGIESFNKETNQLVLSIS